MSPVLVRLSHCRVQVEPFPDPSPVGLDVVLLEASIQSGLDERSQRDSPVKKVEDLSAPDDG